MKADMFFKARSLVCLIIQDVNLSSGLAKNISYALDYSISSGEMLIRLNFYLDQMLSEPDIYSIEVIKLASGLQFDIKKILS
ncbi:hypothetical protein [Pantoea agglomerans]|jgi:hypothetical protein|uniref:hypothetical protein n=1 Tax=Enterobacter agglomerans TaxID=549 RepID=UPI0007E53ECA|nr:hypothetical protein [Pantoea agglomerans]MCL6410174.1 hypothetical protein [Pantoea agglomerans]WHU86797.1 hypothetical protein A7P62_12970 [Pantoea agglomerans pv. gypsophilae]